MNDCIEILTGGDFEQFSEINEVVCELDSKNDDFEIDQSTQFFLGRINDYKCSLRYCVNDDDSLSIELGIRKGDEDVWTSMDKRDALSMAIELIAYASKLDELNKED